MATRKKKTAGAIAAAAVREAIDGAEDEQLVLAGAGLDAEQEDAEAAALEQLRALGEGTDTRYPVTCLSPLDRKGKIDEVTAEDIPELWQYLRDKYGPGRYAVHAVTRGVYVKGSRTIVEISPLAVANKAPATAPAAPAGSSGSELDRWRAEEAARAERAREDRKFLLQLAVTALPTLSGLFRPPSLADQAAAMQALGLGGAARGGASEEKVLEVLIKGMELAKEAQGGNADSWPGLIRETLKDLTSSPLGQSVMDRIAHRQAPAAAAAAPAQPARLGPRVPAQPAAGPPALPAAAPAAGGSLTGNPMFDQLLNKLADELLEFAQNGTDPGLAAEALVAKVPRMARAMLKPEQLQEWLTHPEWWAHVVAFRPALQPYQGFCDDCRQALYAQLVEQGGGGEDQGSGS